MSASCCDQSSTPHRGNETFRRVLWAVLAINVAMFAIEVAAGLAAGSASLQADALDFLGDARNYAISLFVVGMALRYRAMAAFAKAQPGRVGLWVLGVTAWHAWHETLPHAFTMGAVGLAALVANAASFGLLWGFREGDAHMRSAWICTRNDVLGNLAVLLAALGVFGHRHRLARRDGGGDHGEPCSARGLGRSYSVARRAAHLDFSDAGRVSTTQASITQCPVTGWDHSISK